MGEISLEELWRAVDKIRVGTQGYALVLAEDNELIAHGKADGKRLIATAADVPAKGLASRLRESKGEDNSLEYGDETGRDVIATAALVTDRNWAVIVEQPTAEAYAVTHESSGSSRLSSDSRSSPPSSWAGCGDGRSSAASSR